MPLPPRVRPRATTRTAVMATALALLATVVGTVSAARADSIGGPVTGPISEADTTRLESVGVGGAVPNNRSTDPDLSADGRFVVFSSLATNLVPGDTNGRLDVFWRDRVTGETQLVSRADGPDGALGNAASGSGFLESSTEARVSGDGRFVAFVSRASNLTPVFQPDAIDVFVRDVVTDRTHLVTQTSTGEALTGGFVGSGIDISGDGRFVTFASTAANLPGTRGGEVRQVFRRDLVAGTTVLVSSTAAGVAGTANSGNPVMSADGSRIAFTTEAPNLGALPPSGGFTQSVFALRDLKANRITVESRLDGPDGEIEISFGGIISGDGTHVGWTDGLGRELFLRNVATGATVQAATLTDGSLLPGFCCYDFALSADARFLAAHAGDDDDHLAYRRDLATGITTIVSVRSGAGGTVEASEARAGLAMSEDGRFVAFGSTARALAPGDFDGSSPLPTDVFVRDASGPPTLTPRVDGPALQPPAAMSVRASCGAAFCDAVLTGRVVAQRSPGGAGRKVFELTEAATYVTGGQSTTVPLAFLDPDRAVGDLRVLLRDAAYREHSRLEVGIETTGETGSASAAAAFRLRAEQVVVAPTHTVRAKPKRDRRAPFVFALKGRLRGAFAPQASVCRGAVSVVVKQRKRTVVTRTAHLRPDCTWAKKVRIKGGKVQGRGPTKLKVRATHLGNGTAAAVILTPSLARTTVRAR